jgi:hypothetical protein
MSETRKDRKMSNAVNNTLELVDRLGLIEDQIEQLREQQEDLKNQIKLLGAGTYAGNLFITTVKHTAERKTVAWAKVAKELNAPEALVTKYTTVAKDIMSAETNPRANVQIVY